MPTILSDRLKSLTPNSSVLSILEDQPIYGFHRTSLSFKNNFEGDDQTINYKYGKGALRYALDNGDITIHPSKRFVKDGFIFANNPAYDNSDPIWDFPRMYYKPANVDALRNFNQSGGPIYSMTDFKEGGVIFNKVASQEKFKITIGDVTYNQDDFEIVFVELFYWALADFDGSGSVTGGTLQTSDVLDLFFGLRDNGIVDDTDFLGINRGPGFASNPTAAVSRDFYEMIMQFSAYPSATVFGTDEIISNPSQFSVLIYDGKRDSSFQLTISNLATILSSIAAISNGAICGDGVINITAPMLTSGQIQNFFVNASGSSLTAEGAVSTEALLEFLTAFGPCASDDTVFDPSLDSQMSYHSGYNSEVPGEGIVVQNYLQENLGGVVPNTTSNSSFGEIDFTSKPIFIDYSSGSTLTSFLFDDGFSNNLNYADIFWRLHTYYINDFLPHTSNGGTLYSDGDSASIPNRDMPDFNKVVIAGPDFDHILTNSNLAGEAIVFENMGSSDDLYTNTDGMSAFETVEIVTVSAGEVPPWWNPSESQDFTRLKNRDDVSSKYLNANARLEVTVKGFVTCESGDEPIVSLFLRATGTTDGAYDIYTTTDYVYALGVVNMTSTSAWDEENQVNYQEFSFTRDLYDYECFYSDSVTQGSISFPSQTDGGQPVWLGIFAAQFGDNAEKVVITGVKYRYKNQSLV